MGEQKGLPGFEFGTPTAAYILQASSNAFGQPTAGQSSQNSSSHGSKPLATRSTCSRDHLISNRLSKFDFLAMDSGSMFAAFKAELQRLLPKVE